MSRTFHHGERRIRVRAIRNNPTDLRWFARALIELAQAQAEAEAQAAAEKAVRTKKRRPRHLHSIDASLDASTDAKDNSEARSA